jgi:hypothetical protein
MLPIPGDVPADIVVNRFYPLAEMIELEHLDLEDLGPNTRAAYDESRE